MKTSLRKLFGASIGGGAPTTLFVVALTGLIAGAPLAARAQDSAVVGTVTFRDKTANSIVADGVLSFVDITQANASAGNEDGRTNKFQHESTMGLIDEFFSPRQPIGSDGSWTATFTATKTITFDSIRFADTCFFNANWGGVQSSALRARLTVTVGDVSANVTVDWPQGAAQERYVEATLSMGQLVTLRQGETLTLVGDNGNTSHCGIGFKKMEFIGPVPELTVGRPDFTGASFNWSNWSKFTVVPANLYGFNGGAEGELTLGAISVMWGEEDSRYTDDIADAQHVVLVDADGNVVAVSEAPDVTPALASVTSTYRFAGTTLDAAATYTGYFVEDATTVTVGEPWAGTGELVRTRVFVAPSEHTDCYVTDNKTWLAPIGFAFGSGDVDAMEWTATPWFTADAAAEAGAYGKFQVRFQWMWQGERFPWPNEFSLNAVTVPFRRGDSGGPNNANVRRLVLTDSANTVVALSAPLETAPTANADETVTFTFSGERLSPAETYTGYFVGTDYPALGQENYTASPLGNVRFQVRAQVANAGCAVGTSNRHAPDFTFAVSAKEPAPEEEIVNGDAISVDFRFGDSHLVDAETEYGVVPVAGAYWNGFKSSNANGINWNNLAVTDSTGRAGITLDVSASRMQDWYSDASDEDKAGMIPILRSGLADNSTVSLNVEGIPYTTYDLYLYFACDDYFNWDTNCSVTLNGEASTFYYMPEGADVAATSTSNESWGNAHLVTACELGQNVMRIANLTGESLSVAINRVQLSDDSGTRGCLTAFQIVERRHVGANSWEGTLAGVVNASAVEVQNTTTGAKAKLTELGADDVVSLSFTEQVSLTVDADVNADTLTLTGEGENAPLIVQTAQTDGGAIVAENVRLAQGTLGAGVGAFASENPITLATGTTLGVMGTGGAAFTQALTGAGAVEIVSGSDVTLAAAFTHTGGTTVASASADVPTTLRYAGGTIGEGAVTVGPGGIFDLRGLACGQDISLTGGTLANTGAAAVTPQVASVNFNADGRRGNPEPGAAAQVGAGEVAGLVGVLGEHWTAATGGVDAVEPKFVDDANRTASGAAAAPIEGLSVAWDVESDTGLWSYADNASSYLKGYLDDTTNGDAFTRSITLTVPAAVAKAGYDVYLYFASDSVAEGDFNKFSPVSVRAGEGAAATVYSYVNGALTPVATAGRDTGWGDVKAGLNTVAEGINVMVLRHRTEATLQIGIHGYGSANKPSDGPRGSIAALQIKTGTGAETPAYSGTLTVNGADNTLDTAADTVFSGTFVGTGTLTKAGDATLTLTGATTVDAAAMTLKASAGALTFGAGNTLPGLTLVLGADASVEEDVTALTLGALAGSGAFDLGTVSTLTLAGAAAEASYTGALSTDGALSLVKQGANTQRLENLAGVDALAVVAEGGTLALGSGVSALTRLETSGGNVTGLPATVAYAEMAAGNAAAASAATASAARPAAVAQGDVTVTDFTLQDGGEIRYETADDLEKFLPKGFLVAGRTYKVVLAQTLADTLAFPCSFKVQGASGVTLEPYRVGADGTLEKIEAGVVVSGNTLYLNSAAAILGDLSTLPAASHRYPFDGNANDAAARGVNLLNDGTMAYAASDNGQALSGGTPYSNGVSPNPNGEEWTVGLFLNTASAPRNAVLAHFGVGGGDGVPVAGSVVLATGVEPGTLSVWWHDGTDYRNVLTAGLGLGGDAAWHHLLLTHSAQGFRLYVDGEEAAVAPGAYASRPGRLQIGKALGGAIAGLVDGAGRFLLDDLATWPTVLREGQIDLAMAEVTGKWRWNEAATPAELFAADAQWTAADGIAAAWPTENADTYTARATLTLKGTADDLFTALQGFTARTVLLQGEHLTLAVTDTAVDFPATAGTVVVDNDLTLDLSGMDYGFFAQAFSENGVRLVGGVWNGALSLRGTPEGFDFSLDARADGLYLLGTVGAVVASINFRSDAGSIATGETGGLVPMLGQYWVTNDNSASGTATFGLYDLNAATVADSTPTGDSISVTWATGGTWTDTNNTTSYLKGYLDDNGSPSTVTLTVPEAIAQAGYDVYLYSSVDPTGGSTFSAREVTGDDGVMTSYSYVDGVLTDGSTAGWGSAADGRTTVAEGVNVMRLPARTDETLTIAFRNNSSTGNGRGGLAALQVVSYRPRTVYMRDVTDGDTWTESDAWMNATDAADVVDAPTGANVHALVGIDGDTALDMGDLTAVTLGAIETYGDGILTLTFDGDAVAAAIDDAALPEGETYTLVNATLDPDKVRVRVTPTTDGSVVAVSLTATGATATAIAPMGTVYRATVTGAATWDSIMWEPTGTPTASDTAILTLTGDADLAGSASVGMMQVYADGHALSRANTIGAASWHFLDDATLALKQGQTLPTFATAPKRVRYDYPYTSRYTTTAAYETEFAAGYEADHLVQGGGLVEFSGGEVRMTRWESQVDNGTALSATTGIFSGTVRLFVESDSARENGLRLADSTIVFRDQAQAEISRIQLRGSSNTPTSRLTLEGEARVVLTGTQNSGDYFSLHLGDWDGTGIVTVRDNARLIATGADMLLGGTGENGLSEVTIEDEAEVRVRGILRYRASRGAINLNGGRLLIGSSGIYSANDASSAVTLNFAGGAFGAWEDVSLGTNAANVCQTVTGDPTLEVAEGVTLTLEAGANLLPADGNATVRGAGTVKSALATLPALRLEDGLLVVTADAQTPGLELAGGALRLEARLTAGDFAARVPSRVAFLLGGESDAYLSAGEGRVPDLSRVTAVLTLDPDRQAGTLIPYEAPLYLGACDPAATPSIAGFMVENNVGNAIGTQTPVYVAGAQGLGLYARLTGNEVTKPHTVALVDTVDGYRATQSVADTYGYWIFDGQVDGARLLLPSGTLNFREAAFRGQPMTLVASGDEPHLLLQAKALTLNATLTLDLTGWEAALRDFVDGAVDNLPCSLCLIAAESLAGEGVVILAFPDALPEAYKNALSLVPTDRGVYLVARAAGARPAQALSVNFASRAVPLAAPPAAPGAYAVPVAGWNGLAGSFFSADLRVSDLAGVASIPAVGANGQNTQLSATAAAVVSDDDAPATLIQTWLTDDAAQTVRVANIPFAKYRLALILASDYTAAAAYAPVTVGADRYAMDAEGYTRKNVLAYAKTGALGDTAWGSTARDGLSAEDPDVLGLNTLVTDVLEGSAIDIALPRLVYGRTYAGLAALQIVEAPEPEADAGEGTDYAYTFNTGDTELNLADLDLTTADGTAKWQSGPENTLALTVPEGVSATLTLPLNFRAKTLSVSGAGNLTLLTESDGGILLGELDARGLTGDLTVRCPCVGVAFNPGAGVSRFEAAFDNAGEPYTIADGATLALGADSGVAVSLNADGSSPDRTADTLLKVAAASTGTLRRDYAESFNTDWSDTSYRNQTWAFRDLATASGREHVVFSPDLLIEDGDVWSLPDAGIWLQSGANHKTAATLVQTGGTVEIDTIDGANHGFLVASNDDAGLALDFDLSGGRFAASQLMGWGPNASLDLDVTGTGVLALGNGDGNYAGSIAARVASVTMDVAVTDGGVFEPLASTVSAGSAGTHALTFGPGGAIRFGSDTPAEVDMTMPVTFAGTAETPTTIDPGTYGTLVLNAANTGSGALTLARGTLALANASGLGEATVTVASGAAFEARGFTGEGEASEEARTVPVVAIKLDIPAGVGNSDGTAIQEFCLYQGNDKVAWPRGTTISGSPNWAAGGNEAINALIDGVTGAGTSPGTWTNPENGNTGTYTGNARVNKWYPITNTTGTASATITLGDGVVFDAYTLWNSDTQNRFPSGWTLSVRYEGDAEDRWTELDTPSGQTRPAANTESEKYAVTLRTEGGATELDAVTGKVVFASGAQCRAVRKAGVPGLPYVARIAGNIEVAEGTRYFLDGEEFAAEKVDVDAANGLVTFNEGGALEPTAVTWDTANASGTWQDGVAGPWEDGATFINGAAVTFPDVTQPTVATVAGSVKPGTVTFGAGATTAYYTFAGAEDAVLDLSGQVRTDGSTQGRGHYVQMGAGTTFDVPVRTQDATTGLLVPNGAVRLMGVLSDNNRTATLLGTGNLNAAGQHGVWHASGDLTLMPRAGETQRLSAYSGQLYGDGTIIVQGQVANDGSVSGGTVQFGGTSPSGLVNNAFSGTFMVRDGATLDFTMTRADSGNDPFFRASDGTPLYKGYAVGFTLRNGGVLRFSGHRGFLGGWGQISNSTPDLWTSQPIVIGYRSALECVYGSGTDWQHTPYGLRFDGDGATLLIDDGSAAGLGMDFVRGATLTVAGIGDAGDPDDPKTTDGKLTQGITATIETVEGATMRIFGDNGQDDALFLDVGEGSTLRLAADIGSTIPDGTNQTDPAPFVKRGPGRLELTWPTIGNVVEVEVEEGALGGDAELTAGTVTVASGATVEAGLSVTELALENDATLALDPTGARQLRAGTVTFAAGGRYVISALSTPPTPAAGREPVKILSWSNVVDVSAAGFLVDDRLTKAGYGVEIRADGLYLAPAATYVRVLGTVVEDKDYALNWFDRAWHRADDFSTLVDYAPAANETANVFFIVPNSASSVGLRVTLDREVSFATVRFARGKYEDGKLIGIGEQCGGTVDYVYDLTRAEMPSERETRTYAFLPTLAYLNKEGRVETAQFTQAQVPDGYEAEIDGVTATVYLGSGGETGAINVSFTGGSEGSLSWIGTDTAPCGAVPFAGVYWNNASTQGGAGLESLPLATDAYKGYELKPRVSGAQAASATPTVRYAFTAGRAVAGRAGLAAGFLPGPGGNANPGEIGFIEDSGISSAGWAVRVDDIPFARYDLYLLFAGSGDGAATYPAIRLKAGTGAWRTYAFRNGWTAPAGSGDAWAGQAVLDEGFADGANLLHLRIEGGGSLQIVPHDGANRNNAEVGLAALQIVEIPQGQPAFYAAQGPTWSGQTWSYAATGATGATQNVPAAAWQDATPDAPHYALLDGLTRLDVDRAAALPFLRRTGSGSLELTGTAGTLSAGTLDLLEASGTITVHEDLFAQAPNVILGDAVTLVPFPNAAADASLAWRWVYPDDVAHTATLSKQGPYGLTLTQPVVNRLQIDDGTLWLTQAANADNYPGDITGDGTLGWAGNAFRVAFNNLPDGSADADGVFLRVASGTVTLAAVAGSSLPSGGKVEVSDGATLQFNNNNRNVQQRPFPNGTFLARDGGIVHYNGLNASNLFPKNEITQLPSIRLEGGLFQQTLEHQVSPDNGTEHYIVRFVSSGDSRYYLDSAGSNPWDHKALCVRSGRIQVEEGTLGIHSSLGNGTGSKNSVVLLPNAETSALYGDGSSTTHGYLDVATGAALFSHYPIYAGSSGSNNTLAKVGGGVWVQTQNVCQTVGYNGGKNTDTGGTDPYDNIEIREGTFRLNMGDDVLEVPADTAAPRNITVATGARLDGTGTVSDDFSVTIERGATLSSGHPADATWVPASSQWNANFPNHFKGAAGRADGTVYLDFQGSLSFADGAILEVDLERAAASTNALVRVSGEGARVSLGSSLTVRLTNLQTAFDGPVKLTNFAVDPNSQPPVNCPEAIALDGDVRWLTDAEALGDESANGTVHNLWLIASGDSYVWTDPSGNWSDANWTHQGATTDIVNGITAPEDAPKARVVADSADVALTVDQDPAEPNQPDWGLHGLVLSADQERGVTLAQGGTLGGTVDAPTGTLNGLSIDASLWKVGPGTARVDALAKLKNGAILAVNEGTLALTRPLLRADPSAGQSANTLGADLSIEQGATLTFAFAEPTDLEEAYFEGKAIDPQALTLNGSFSGAGTLRVEGAGNQVTLASLTATTARQDGALSYSVGKGARLTLDGDTPAAVGEATPRTLTVEGTLDLASERALGATTAWTWELADGALVTTADDARIRGTVRLADGAATLGRDSQQWDGDLTAEVGAGATLTFTGNIQTPDDAPAAATFAKRGAGTAVIDDAGYFSPGLHVDVAEGTLRVEGTLSVTPGDGRDVVPAWTVRGGATLALGGGTCSFSDGSLTVEAGGVLDCADGAITLNTGVDRPALLKDGARLRFGSGTGLNEQAGLTIPTGLRVEGRVAVEVAVDNPAGLRLSEYPLIAFGNSARQGTGTFVLGGANVTALAAAGWTLEDRGADGVYLVAFGNGQNYVWAGTAAGWLDGDAWVYNGASTPTTWVDGTSQGAVSFLDERPIGGVEVPGEYRTVGSTGTQTVTALRSENSGGDYALEGSGGLTVQGLLLKVGGFGLTFRRPVTFGNGGAINVQEGTVTFADTLGSTDNPAALLAPVTLGQGAKLAFSGNKARTLSGDFDAAEGSTLAVSGGALTLAGDVTGLGSLRAEGQGTNVALTAPGQALALGGADAPTFALGAGATLTLGGDLPGGGTVAPKFDAATQGATLRWEGVASVEATSVPRLGALGGAVSTLVYAPRAGHLILDPGSLADGAALSLENDGAETTALWLGAGDGTAEEAIRLSALTASGAACVGVEPERDLAGAAWAAERTLTLALSGDAAFGGTFMGAADAQGDIRAGLTLEKADPAAAGTPTFTYSGESTDGTVGTLTAKGVRVAVTGEWAGAATAEDGGVLGGSGTLGDVALGAGGALSANAADVRGELAPATLTLGSLRLWSGAALEVLGRVDEATGATNLSLVAVAGSCRLEQQDVEVEIRLDIADGAAVNNRKILGWDALDGYQRITCVVKVPDGQGGWQESDDYAVRRGDDGLYLFRTSARFWMILR